MVKLDTLSAAFIELKENMDTWLGNNSLQVLKKYEELQNKESIGPAYREDQKFFEDLSTFKADLFSLRSYIFENFINSSNRIDLRKAESLNSSIDAAIKRLDTLINAARQRIKFYESVIYLVSNMSYGDY